MITVQEDFNLRPYNTFRIDAKCSRWIEYTEASDLPAVMDMVGEDDYINIGAGSNMLFMRDYAGVVLHSRILDVVSIAMGDCKIVVRAGSGVTMDSLIEQCCRSGLWGLENLSDIPGDVGSAAVQNVGAYGVEACDVIKSVECFDTQTRGFVIFHGDQCRYAYRDSMFKHSDAKRRYIIVYVEFKLSTIAQPHIDYGSLRDHLTPVGMTPMEVRKTIIEIRNSRLPKVDEIGSAGSFFKNPVVDRAVYEQICRAVSPTAVPHYDVGERVKIPAAWLIDQCGFKGFQKGNVAVWDKQPLVIVNLTGKASAAEILELEKMITDRVEATFGIRLEPEVEHIG